jgi:2-polyprenyl-3-methyl-5-hydroxy-6-metoxy-1,4-benzoquinol methylase
MIVTKLKMFDSYDQEVGLLEEHVKTLFDGKSELEILEAGCGRNWPLKLDGIKYKLTGVDIDNKALESRVDNVKDLDETIVADLRHLDLGSRKFDVIYNSFVLEHVENAGLVLENFNHWLRPGGLLILKIPDRNTVFGFLTKITPFWFHVAYYKYILGRKKAGKPGFGPYPTYYDLVVSRNGIRDFCKSHGIAIIEEYGLCTYRLENGIRSQVVRFVAVIVNALSMGRLPWKHNNLTYVLKKM